MTKGQKCRVYSNKGEICKCTNILHSLATTTEAPLFLVPRLQLDLLLFPIFQPGMTPCTSGGGGKGKKSMLLGSCIARTNSEEDLQELAKRPISPGHRGTTWNGK